MGTEIDSSVASDPAKTVGGPSALIILVSQYEVQTASRSIRSPRTLLANNARSSMHCRASAMSVPHSRIDLAWAR